jgi:signal transduction histidine kinase
VSFLDLAALSIHDVKNRLAALAARAEVHGDGETVRDALAAAAELTRLLACYKADAGQLRAAIDGHCPTDLVADLVAECRPAAGLQLAIDDRQAPPLWFYDDYLVRMVLANALQNALRFARRQVRLSVAADDEWLEFAVADDGDGYPAELLAEPLRSSSLNQAGSGVGLYLAHQVAALHGNRGRVGSVTLRNAGGAVFALRLPR